jgi:hypothetical protein
MLARFQRGDRKFHVRIRRRTDVNNLNIRISEQVGEILRGFDSHHVQFKRLIGADIPCDAGKVAVEMPPAWIAQSRNAHVRHVAIRLDVRHPHEAECNNTYVHLSSSSRAGAIFKR